MQRPSIKCGTFAGIGVGILLWAVQAMNVKVPLPWLVFAIAIACLLVLLFLARAIKVARWWLVHKLRSVLKPRHSRGEEVAAECGGLWWILIGYDPADAALIVVATCLRHRVPVLYREYDVTTGLVRVERRPTDSDVVGKGGFGGMLWCADGGGHGLHLPADGSLAVSFGQLRLEAQVLLESKLRARGPT